jgi:hypothetical protein
VVWLLYHSKTVAADLLLADILIYDAVDSVLKVPGSLPGPS